ncbi:MAG: DUF4111 domain-containing protein [Trueperaceae bacterium]|nr:DUF4111 domain-containing protein [Trueperaceae bacterium]
MAYSFETCPVATKEQLNELVLRFRNTLGENLVGIYLHGSLAMASFNPDRSDLDLLAVTRNSLSGANKGILAKCLLELSRQPHPVEISLLHFAQLKHWQHPCSYDFHYSESWRKNFEAELLEDDWHRDLALTRVDPDLAAHITVLRERGLVLTGEAITRVFPEVPKKDYLASIRGDVLESLATIRENPVYTVLNACRSLAFLQDSKVRSKKEGGEWALAELPSFCELVAAALHDYETSSQTLESAGSDLEAFASYIREVFGTRLSPIT